MNKAEEFEKGLPVRRRGGTGMNRYEFAEAYLQHKVNAISDEDIENQFNYNLPYSSHRKLELLSKQQGAKWFKEQLLKEKYE